MSRFLRTKEGQYDHDYMCIMDFSNILMSRRALMATCVISKEITVRAWDEDCHAFRAWGEAKKPEMECPCKAEMFEWCRLRREAIIAEAKAARTKTAKSSSGRPVWRS